MGLFHLKATTRAFACVNALLSPQRALGLQPRKASRSPRHRKSELSSWLQLCEAIKSRPRRVCGIFQCHIRGRPHSPFRMRTGGNLGHAFSTPQRPPAFIGGDVPITTAYRRDFCCYTTEELGFSPSFETKQNTPHAKWR
jgi:hypothetical protein